MRINKPAVNWSFAAGYSYLQFQEFRDGSRGFLIKVIGVFVKIIFKEVSYDRKNESSGNDCRA